MTQEFTWQHGRPEDKEAVPLSKNIFQFTILKQPSRSLRGWNHQTIEVSETLSSTQPLTGAARECVLLQSKEINQESEDMRS